MEVAVDVIVVDLDQNPPRYEEERRVFKPEYILDLCGSMLHLDTSPESEDVVDNRVESRTITAAHSSVSDFFEFAVISNWLRASNEIHQISRERCYG